MRLIDADVLESVDFSECMDSMEIMAIIDAQPTIFNNGLDTIYKGLTTKKNDNGEFNETWVEGDLIHSGDKFYIHPISNKVKVENELGSIIIMHEVQPNTITLITRNIRDGAAIDSENIKKRLEIISDLEK